MFLLAPTVPSEPSPKKTARSVSAGSMSSDVAWERLRPETSSLMPTVNLRRGRSLPSSSKTPATMAGVSSLEANPYRPPVTSGMTPPPAAACASARAQTTSSRSGSPSEPGSLVRSSTLTRATVGGNAARKASAGNGRKRRIVTTPTRSPRPQRYSTVSRVVSAPDPMTTTTRSASGCPV